jgi:hypothetical protein
MLAEDLDALNWPYLPHRIKIATRRGGTTRNVWQHVGMHVRGGLISEQLAAHGSALFRFRTS